MDRRDPRAADLRRDIGDHRRRREPGGLARLRVEDFDQPFDSDAVVGEVRQSIDEFLGSSLTSRSILGRGDLAKRVDHTRQGATAAAKLGMKCRLVQESWIPALRIRPLLG